MVVLGDDLENGHLDVRDVDVLAVQVEFVLVELVLLVDVRDKLLVCPSCDVDTLVEPPLHAREVLDELLVLDVVVEADVLRHVVRDGVHQREADVQKLGRHVVERLADRLGIVVPRHPTTEDAAITGKAEARGHQREVLDLSGNIAAYIADIVPPMQ